MGLTFRYFSLFIVTSLSLSACAHAGIVAHDSATQSGQTAQFSLRNMTATEQAELFSEYYSQKIEWNTCADTGALDADLAQSLESAGVSSGTIECAHIVAPLDWAQPDSGESITLAVSRMKAEGQSHGVIFSNPGGPGESGLNLWFDKPLTQAGQSLSVFDRIGFDPRGIGQSTPVECALPETALDDQTEKQTDTAVDVQSGHTNNNTQADAQAEEIQEFLASCATDTPLAAHMGTLQVARDMELMRHLFGGEKLDYLGYSYGTILGATYATFFPENTGRMVLDSAENAAWATPIHQAEQGLAIAHNIAELGKQCEEVYVPTEQVERCPYITDEDLRVLKTRADEHPWQGSEERFIDGATLYQILTSALYYPDTERAATLDWIDLASQGNAEAVDTLLTFLDSQDGAPEETDDTAQSTAEDSDTPQSDEEELTDSGFNVAQAMVTCHSTPRGDSSEVLRKYLSQKSLPAFVSLDEMVSMAMPKMCEKLPFTGDDITDRFSASTVTQPILVIGVTGDHATPYPYAKELVTELGKAKLLTVEGAGHAASLSDRSACIDEAVIAYFLHGNLPADGVRCTLEK